LKATYQICSVFNIFLTSLLDRIMFAAAPKQTYLNSKELPNDLLSNMNFLQTFLCYLTLSAESSVGIATGYGIDGRGSIAGRGNIFFPPLNIVRIGSGAHPVCYPIGTGGYFPGGKAAGE
jgi:hypothetical protein